MSQLTFLRPKPDVAYLDRDLWLPLQYIPVESFKRRLSFWVADGKSRKGQTQLHVYRQEKDHLVVPRNFLSVEEVRSTYGLDLVDRRPQRYEPLRVLHSIAPRSHQVRPLKLMEREEDGTLSLACGKGKTVMALYEAARAGVPTLVVCNNTSILKGWEKEIQTRLSFEGEIGWVKGSKLPMDAPIALSTIQGLANKAHDLPLAFLNKWGLIVYDEAHHVSARVFCRAANLFRGRRLALTATPKRNDGLERIYQYHLGGVFYKDTVQTLSPKITFLHLTKVIPPRRATEEDVYLKNWIAKNTTFNNVAAAHIHAAVKSGRKVMALSHRKVQLEILETQLPLARLVHGGIALDERQESLQDGNPVLGTMQLAREGLDRPELDTLFVLTLFSNENDFEQTLGRILRGHEGKKHPHVYFLVPSAGRCLSQARRLRGFARKRNYTIEEKKI